MLQIGSNAFQEIYSSDINWQRSWMSEKRRLRSGGACNPIENIFKTEHYREVLPAAIFNRVTNTPTINCDKIKSMKIETNSDHVQNLKLMKQATMESIDLKSCTNKCYWEESNSIQKRNEPQMHQYGQEILNINFLKQIDQFIMQ